MRPENIELIRHSALRALGVVKAADGNTRADKHFLFNRKQVITKRNLPSYYLVYFLLVDLLGFKNLGRFEKIAWSIPIDYHGQAFLLEHGKFGFGLYAHDPESEGAAAEEIATRVRKAVKAATPFFDYIARQAVERSEVNVVNNSMPLLSRFEFMREIYQSKCAELVAQSELHDLKIKQRNLPLGVWSFGGTFSNIRQETSWLAISAIEAFFSWTEHVLIHIAILSGRVTSACEIADLAAADWSRKFKAVFDMTNEKEKALFDSALSMRQELRNYIAHGAFGKGGEAFSFHSSAGAVPVLLPEKAGSKRFSIGSNLEFNYELAFGVVDNFVMLIWSGKRAPAQLYIQGSNLPAILTFCADGTYSRAMTSLEEMENLVEYLSNMAEQAVNMDW
ncbi:hypothetical protein G7017_07055 [Pseudomonas fulva]|nr:MULTISPECIES: hypothetical protein [Pseudomonas putida group]MBA1220658.1 hypothetical protein [Pseudomonas fulva]MBH3452056.1 hypothetical protein [Pseudomonas putida]MDQ2486799.1 hypothetical protein [Pseudomonas putida]